MINKKFQELNPENKLISFLFYQFQFNQRILINYFRELKKELINVIKINKNIQNFKKLI